MSAFNCSGERGGDGVESEISITWDLELESASPSCKRGEDGIVKSGISIVRLGGSTLGAGDGIESRSGGLALNVWGEAGTDGINSEGSGLGE